MIWINEALQWLLLFIWIIIMDDYMNRGDGA